MSNSPSHSSHPTPGSLLLTVNGGSSSVKFALFDLNDNLRRNLTGRIEGIGRPQGVFSIKDWQGPGSLSRPVAVSDYKAAVNLLMDWADERIKGGELRAVGHRVVHGGPKYWEPQRITPTMIDALRQLRLFDPEHLPEEILLIEAFHRRFADLPQIACFDTAFHHDLPRVARVLPIPRRYEALGVRRYGFHGLSCTYLMEALARAAGSKAASKRVILAHLGNGASMTAVREGHSVDTSMSFTPASGLPMSSRSGDLDPGLALYLARTVRLTAKQFHHMVNHEAGLLGISGTTSDMRGLLQRKAKDGAANEAVGLFCYQARKWTAALAAALEGLDTLVFSGGIGENSPEVRAQICRGLGFIGIRINSKRNEANAAIISPEGSEVTVRVIATDEEQVIANLTRRVLGWKAEGAKPSKYADPKANCARHSCR